VNSDPKDPKLTGLLDPDPDFCYNGSGAGSGYRSFLFIKKAIPKEKMALQKEQHNAKKIV
jgi:hypothetical protein